MLAAAVLRGAGSRRLMAASHLRGALISGPAAPPRPRPLSDAARQPPPPPFAGGLWPRSMSTFPHIKPQVKICAIGHAEHGKSTLAAAIAKVMSDTGRSNVGFLEEMKRALEEKARGITLTTAPLEFETAKRRYAHVDCPGHGEYVKYMITQAAEMAGGILVVSAVDGPMPQTEEHLRHAHQVGLHSVICFLNKVDNALCPGLVEIAEWKVREMLSACNFPGDEIPIIRGSALSALNGTDDSYGTNAILELMDALDAYIPDPKSQYHFGQGSQVGAPAYVLNESQIALLVDRAIDVCSDRIADKALQKIASRALMDDPLLHKLVDTCADKIAAKNADVLQDAVADITAVVDERHKSLEAATELQLSETRTIGNIGKGVLAILVAIVALIVYCLYALWAKADEIANSSLGKIVRFVVSLFGG